MATPLTEVEVWVRDGARGLDHGAWIPMILTHPEPTIPVFQVAIDPHTGPSRHLRLGETLCEFRAGGVLILASSKISHNLGEVQCDKHDREEFLWVFEFVDWVHDRA